MAETVRQIIAELRKLDVFAVKREDGYEIFYLRDPRAVKWLAKLPNIVVIGAGGTVDGPQALTREDWASLGEQPRLRRIAMTNVAPFSGKDHSVFRQFKALREFHHSGIKTEGDAALAEICQCPGIEILGLERGNIPVEGMKHIRQLTKLKVLRITGIEVTGELKNILPDSPLESLTADECKLNDDDVRFLTRFTWLSQVTATKCLITDAALRDFAKMKSLRVLFLCNNSLTTDALADFLMTSTLDEVMLSPDQVSHLTVTALEHSRLKSLFVVGDGRVPDDLKARLLRRFTEEHLSITDDSSVSDE
jgi:hypothetical protein